MHPKIISPIKVPMNFLNFWNDILHKKIMQSYPSIITNWGAVAILKWIGIALTIPTITLAC